jgi:hypothetical protein
MKRNETKTKKTMSTAKETEEEVEVRRNLKLVLTTINQQKEKEEQNRDQVTNQLARGRESGIDLETRSGCDKKEKMNRRELAQPRNLEQDMANRLTAKTWSEKHHPNFE